MKTFFLNTLYTMSTLEYTFIMIIDRIDRPLQFLIKFVDTKLMWSAIHATINIMCTYVYIYISLLSSSIPISHNDGCLEILETKYVWNMI